MGELEELLNKCIQRGRVPFGDEKIHSFEIIYVTGKIRNIVAKRGRGQLNMHYSIIELCSKSSGLWQFVCENGMVLEQVWCCEEYHWAKCTADKELMEHYSTYSLEYEYRLIESSLKNEDELEEFLLQNIKVEGKND